ncbi:MAG: type II toxin-antitoxin system PemK/MazF family toxin [Acidobacteria bacterium]|jgi:mRNA interferase MazF|nr:type II toxin-antitoxin system PemK/MazF family toxin [Acidobacteriota bacterium]
MTAFEQGDVILVPVPFTDTSAVKQRPAVVVSGRRYNRERPDLIVMPVTSNVAPPRRFGDFPLERWRSSGLLKPSLVKPVLATIASRAVRRRLGALPRGDAGRLARHARRLLVR